MITQTSVAVVAEKEDFYSGGLTAVLKHQIGYPSILRARSLSQLFAIVAESPVDLLILADDVLGEDASETVRDLRAQYPKLRIAVFTRSCEVREVLSLLAAGAQGVISKRNCDSAELLRALRTISEDGTFVPAMAELDDGQFEPVAGDALAGLTERQRQVIKLLSKGYPNKVIARELGISPCTVKVHVHAAFRALGVHSRMAAVAALRPPRLQAASRN